MNARQMERIDRNVIEVLRELRIVALWLTIVAVAIAAVFALTPAAEGGKPASVQVEVKL